ncbi:MAG: alkaline phosphatase family protein [Tepidisphaeraceae bacterium]
MRRLKTLLGPRCILALALTAAVPEICPAAEYVVHISVDGLRADAITKQTADQLPFFSLLRTEGAFTDNARTDVDYTITLPNHTGMLTGRGVVGPAGHNYTDNDVPPPGQTLHTVKGSYVASVFDVAHDNGLRTGLFASKEKFGLFDTSYDADTAPLQGGSPDTTGADNGRDKIDTFEFNYDSPQLVSSWKTAMQANPFQYSFIHLHDPDSAGHSEGWNVSDTSSLYMQAVRDVDARLGEIMATIENTPELAGHTTLILSADHGGQEETTDHSDPADPQDYTIPFYVWGADVTEGDLYAFNTATRANPARRRSPTPTRCSRSATPTAAISRQPAGARLDSRIDDQRAAEPQRAGADVGRVVGRRGGAWPVSAW